MEGLSSYSGNVHWGTLFSILSAVLFTAETCGDPLDSSGGSMGLYTAETDTHPHPIQRNLALERARISVVNYFIMACSKCIGVFSTEIRLRSFM